MPRVIEVDGRPVEFPDSMSDEEILSALRKLSATPPLPTAPTPPPTFEPPKTAAEKEEERRLQAEEATQRRVEPKGQSGTALARELTTAERKAAQEVTYLPAGADRPVTMDTAYVAPMFRPTRIRQMKPEVAPPVAAAPKIPEEGLSGADRLRARYANLEQTQPDPELRQKAQALIIKRLRTMGELDVLSDAELSAEILAEGDTKRQDALMAELTRREEYDAAQMKKKTTAEVQRSVEPPAPIEGERKYLDPDTGELRDPTAFEELWEALAMQQVMSPQAAADAAERIARSQAELDRRIAAGEDVGFYEYAGPLFSGILSTPDRTGAGVTETQLGAALRGTLGAVGNLAAEGYFRGLGYEVDEQGVPKDPDDFGLALKDLRDTINEKSPFPNRLQIPEVLYPMQMAKQFPAWLASFAGEESEAAVENLFKSIPQVAIPLPGMATQSTTMKTTTYDPEGRRRVSSIEVPPINYTEGWDAFKASVEAAADAEARRLARNIASGRTIGDEILDTPSMREWYADVWGDEDAAYWAGSIGDLAMPAGPGTAFRGLKTVGSAAARSKAGAQAAARLIESANTARKAGKVNTVKEVAANLAAAAVPGKASDARVVRRVAEQVLDEMIIEDDIRKAAKAAIRDDSDTLAKVFEDVGPVLDPEYVSPFKTPFERRRAKTLDLFDRVVESGAIDDAEELTRAYVKRLHRDAGNFPEGELTVKQMRTIIEKAGVGGGREKLLLPQVGKPQFSRAVMKGMEKNAPFVRRMAVEGIESGMSFAPTLDAVQGNTVAANLIADSRLSGPARYFGRRMAQTLPEDMVMVSENIAVPRGMEKQARDILMRERRSMFTRDREDLVRAVTARLQNPDLPRGQARSLNRLRRELETMTDEVIPTKTLNRLARAGVDVQTDVKWVGQVLDGTRYEELGARLKAADSWADVSLEDKRFLTEVIPESYVIAELGGYARKARDLTNAQIELRGLESFWKNILGDSMEARKLRAQFRGSPLPTETVAVRNARKTIRASTQQVIKRYGRELTALTKETKVKGEDKGVSVDRAIDILMRRYLDPELVDFDVASIEEIWLKALENLYGDPELAKNVYASAKVDLASLGLEGGYDPFQSLPTVAHLRAVDRAYARAGKFAETGRGAEEGTTFLTKFLAPDYQKAMIKTTVEEGARKDAIAKARRNEQLLAGIEDVAGEGTFFARFVDTMGDDLLSLKQRLIDASRVPSESAGTVREVPGFGVGGSRRLRVYDPSLSTYEKILAESGDSFAQLAESIDPRKRVSRFGLAGQALSWGWLGANRNWDTTLRYGFLVPNLPYIGYRAGTIPVLSAVTSGLSDTGASLANIQRVMRRRTTGEGLVLPDGQYLTPAELHNLAEEAGLGLTAIDTARVGSLTDDIIADAYRATGLSAAAFEEANPFGRTYGMRLAESMEYTFRQAFFEARLLEGDSVPVAAEKARRALLNYDEVPEKAREFIGKVYASGVEDLSLIAEAAAYAVQNPSKARAALKALEQKADYQDPYGIKGDKALKSLGVVKAGPGDEYYVPLPILDRAVAPIEFTIGAARNGNALLAALARVAADPNVANAMSGVNTVFESGVEITRELGDIVLPTVTSFAESKFGLGEGAYKTQGLDWQNPITDESALWAAAILAHANDLRRDNGQWADFLNTFPVDFTEPPPQFAAYPDATDDKRLYWRTQPPEGMPYLVWGTDTDTGETIYKTFEPTEQARFNMAAFRKIPFRKLQEGYNVYQAAVGEQLESPVGEPVAVRGGTTVPSIEGPSEAFKVLLPKVPTPEAERARQATVLSEVE